MKDGFVQQDSVTLHYRVAQRYAMQLRNVTLCSWTTPFAQVSDLCQNGFDIPSFRPEHTKRQRSMRSGEICTFDSTSFAQVSDLCDNTIEVFNFAAKTDGRSCKLLLF